MTLQEELREYCVKLQSKPLTLSDCIPLLKRAADMLDAKDQNIAYLEQECGDLARDLSYAEGQIESYRSYD